MSPKTQVALLKTIGIFLAIVLIFALFIFLSIITNGLFFGITLFVLLAAGLFYVIFTVVSDE